MRDRPADALTLRSLRRAILDLGCVFAIAAGLTVGSSIQTFLEDGLDMAVLDGGLHAVRGCVGGVVEGEPRFAGVALDLLGAAGVEVGEAWVRGWDLGSTSLSTGQSLTAIAPGAFPVRIDADTSVV